MLIAVTPGLVSLMLWKDRDVLGRFLVVTHDWQEASYQRSSMEALRRVAGQPFDIHVTDATLGLPPGAEHYDAVVTYVRFRELRELPTFDWGRFSGLRVLWDEDALQEFTSPFGDAPYEGQWSATFKRLRFDRLICTGRKAADVLSSRGVAALVVPKGYDPAYFHDLGLTRQGNAHYGVKYRARAAMLRVLRNAHIEVTDVHAGYTELNAALNRFQTVLVCNMMSRVCFGSLGKAVERVRPGTALILEQAPEPMIKNFEAMASGACVFMDRAPDLADLGFVDGVNCLIYDSFDDLIDKIREYEQNPSDLRRIGAAGAQFVAGAHTLDHRARELTRLLEQELAGPR